MKKSEPKWVAITYDFIGDNHRYTKKRLCC